ncbi:FAD/NAD(P)-binding domain-containing protein [Tothia fuscella]|uniref:FAD/NAD(P)-binding domain-containing protein n=1 Tax=Tothia fuscella TaxID=1048955 RepID=A0A9P4NFF3_9PEZI|nr:FAD/NAD(P)-binding domain-containing protein [Tothia fuscella]
MASQPITIIGAGIAGLTLSRTLLNHGIKSIIFEKAPSKPRHEYGITLYSYAYKPLLKVLGLDEESFMQKVAVDGGVGGRGCGRIDGGKIVKQGGGWEEGLRVNRAKLERILEEGLDVRWDCGVEGVGRDGSGDPNTVHLKNGDTMTSNIIIGLDGVHSQTRKSLLPTLEPTVLPFVALNGKRRVPKAVFEQVYSPHMKESNIVEMKVKDTILHISINDISNEQTSISWNYSRPSHILGDILYKPNRPQAGASEMPEEFFTGVPDLGELPQPFAEVFDVEKLRMERILHWLMRTVVPGPDHFEQLQALGERGIFFLGDAIHAQQIIGGWGADEAIVDAIGFADAYVEGGVDGVRKWYEESFGRWKDGVERSERNIGEMHGEKGALL